MQVAPQSESGLKPAPVGLGLRNGCWNERDSREKPDENGFPCGVRRRPCELYFDEVRRGDVVGPHDDDRFPAPGESHRCKQNQANPL